MKTDRCEICPRRCLADRSLTVGACGADETMEVSKIMLHHWEEPPISGDSGDPAHGSGAVFFTHCSLGCVYCQNGKISRTSRKGERYSPARLADAMSELERSGAYNVNLVSPTHYTLPIIEAVALARKAGLTIPIVWNTGGYERTETIRLLDGTADIFLTDFKYASPELAKRYSRAEDYPKFAAESLAEMAKLAGPCVFDENGRMKRGVIVRHLVLPGHRDDSVAVLQKIAELVDPSSIRLSLMAQFTPDFLPPKQDGDDPYAKLRRKVTSFEYDRVADEAIRLGFDGYMQERSSATARFTPDF